MAKKKEPKKDKNLEPLELNIDGLRLDTLYQNVKSVIERARATVYKVANSETLKGNWEIGKYIVEEEQHGKVRAEYGKFIIKNLSVRLVKEYGEGFLERTLERMRKFYLTFPIPSALQTELSWTHYKYLITVESENARNFYINEAIQGY